MIVRVPFVVQDHRAKRSRDDLGSREHWVAGPPRDDDRPNVARFGTTT